MYTTKLNNKLAFQIWDLNSQTLYICYRLWKIQNNISSWIKVYIFKQAIKTTYINKYELKLNFQENGKKL